MKHINIFETSEELLFYKKDILKIKKISDIVYLYTSKNEIIVFSLIETKIIYKMSALFINYKTNNELKLIDFINDFFMYYEDGIIYIYNIKKSFLIRKINLKHKTIINFDSTTVVKFLTKDKFIVGDELGHSDIFNTDGKIVYRLRKHKDYTHYIEHSIYYLNSGSFNGMITVNNAKTYSEILHIFISNSPIEYIKTINKEFIIIVNRNNSVFLLNVYKKTKTILNEYFKTSDYIVHIEIFDNFIYLFQKHGALIIFDYINMKTIEPNIFIDNSFFMFIEKNIIYILRDNFISKINLTQIKTMEIKRNEDKETLKSKVFLLQKNPFFNYKKEKLLKQIDELFYSDIKSMFLMLDNSIKREDIYSKIDKYQHISKYKKELPYIYNSINLYKNYKNLFENKKYNLCYVIAEKDKYLKQTKEYLSMENSFDKIVDKILQVKNEKEFNLLYKLLLPYKEIDSKKELVLVIIEQLKVIKLLNEVLSEKNYKTFFYIVEKFPELKKLNKYKEINIELDLVLENLYEPDNIENIEKKIQFLKNNEEKYKEDIVKSSILLKEYKNFLEMIKDCEFDIDYNYIEVKKINLFNNYIMKSNEFDNYDKHFYVLYNKLYNFKKLNFKIIVKYMSNYINNKYKLMIDDLFIKLYENQINELLKKNNLKKYDYKIIIDKYINLIGMNMFIKNKLLKFKLKTLKEIEELEDYSIKLNYKNLKKRIID